jgi:hypothetical protein
MEQIKKGRRGRRPQFVMPIPPMPVRILWEAAQEEEKQKAHQTGVVILETWLGKTTCKEAAAKLAIPPVRFSQLSKQALAGMVAGLLKQPRARRKDLSALGSVQDNPTRLKARILALEKQLSRTESLVELLRQMPAQKKEPQEKHLGRKKKTAPAKRSRPPDRTTPSLPQGAARDRQNPQRERTDAPQLAQGS